MSHTFEFEYEVEALGQSVTVTVTATQSSFPHDGGPDGEGEIEIEGVTLGGHDVDTDGIKVCKMVPTIMPQVSPYWFGSKPRQIPKWFTLTELIREAAWEWAEMEAA